MGMTTKIKMLLAARNMTVTELALKLNTTPQNLAAKLKRDNFSENDLKKIASMCNSTFEGSFHLIDTGKNI